MGIRAAAHTSKVSSGRLLASGLRSGEGDEKRYSVPGLDGDLENHVAIGADSV